MYYRVSPEVAGDLGPQTVSDDSTWPPTVTFLEFEFNTWLGDDLLEGFACFIVTERLGKAIKGSSLTGVELANVLVTPSDEFHELYPGRELPKFYWLKLHGKPAVDDFGVWRRTDLVVSAAALVVLQQFNLENATVKVFKLPPSSI